MRKLGDNAIPFKFDFPENDPPSVTLQPGSDDQGSPLGVEYELKLFIADNKEEKPHRRNSVSMAIRKLQYYQPRPMVRQPSTIGSKGFVLSPSKLQLEVTLDKGYYFHGDKIAVQMVVTWPSTISTRKTNSPKSRNFKINS
ncbi:unnamed protein product [Larinioides sclopetarius]|uniref:Arrestin-like N-terminal domain-containing protein n=1 Tax=Larinioides sclopetarius TaxID=280406 RepID=A0AAV2A5R9_9ARAC